MKLNLLKEKYYPYISALELPINEELVLLEAGQGKNLNGNMFAIVRELCTNEKWKNLTPIFVVTKENLQDAKKRFEFYEYKVKLVERESAEYCRVLATAKYLLTDNSFPPFFSKREEQVYLNTWHGTPLKTLGKSDIQNAKSLANLQKNYLMADYALFPNEFTRDVFMKDYMLENVYIGKILLCDYPRNSIFLDNKWQRILREKLKLEHKQLIAYMPTWRGTNRSADAEIQKEILHKYFLEIDRQLSDDQVFCVNLHFLVGNTMDFSVYKHIQPFPKEYETYDFLSICDILVTDYSSVFFDYAISEKKVILFAYDLKDYMRDRGTYFPITDLPFPIVYNVDELIEQINNGREIEKYSPFLNTYCKYKDINTPFKILNLLVNENASGLSICNAPNNGKKLELVYGGKLSNKQLNIALHEYLQERSSENNKNIVLCFRGKINKKTVEFLGELPENVNYIALVSKYNFSFKQKILAALSIRIPWLGKWIDKYLDKTYKNENRRMFFGIRPEKAIYFSGEPQYIYKIFSKFTCEKEAHIQNDSIWGLKAETMQYQQMLSYFKENYDNICDHRKEEDSNLWLEDEAIYYNKRFKVGSVLKLFKNTKSKISLTALVIYQSTLPIPIDSLKIKVGEQVVDGHLKEGLRIWKNYCFSILKISIPEEVIKHLSIQNSITICGEDNRGYRLEKKMTYRMIPIGKKGDCHGPIKVYEESETAAYFRQTLANTICFTVRKTNMTDTRKEQIKLFWAHFLAKVLPMRKKIILFEKESSRYEESASVLYEKLIDLGYKNAYFIIDFSYPYLNDIPNKYRCNLIKKGSFRHYLYFFKSKTFLGSEALVHAIDLRITNKYAQRKLQDNTIDYVFLQHGVMYMVSLDSESRKFFKPKKTKGKYRVVVSSKKEERHFIELGGYNPEHIYISGLPKFDKNVMNVNADKIVIMPTWRPWEYNEARYNFQDTKYYQMVYRIFHAIPEKYREKIVILPHPLFFDAVKDAEFELKKYLDSSSKYDDVLKETKVLITDYSSIAYDAYYRGANVIFYWEEKDECLENYGPSTKLMLNKDNVYGDVCYSADELSKVFEKNYLQGQTEMNLKRYRKIVQYYDGKNTERLVSFLKKDEII